jgi:hypothetical protein
MTSNLMRCDLGLFAWLFLGRRLPSYVDIVTGMNASTVCFLCYLGSFLPTRLSTNISFLVSDQRASFFKSKDVP